jgi:hypothetical protein
MTAAEKGSRSPLMSTVIVIVAVVGTVVTIGCLLAIRLEVIGLGAPRDTDPRAGYIAVLVTGAAAGVLIPAAACFFLLKSGKRIVVVVAAFATLLVALFVLGAGW